MLFGERNEVTIDTCNAILTTKKFELEGKEEQDCEIDLAGTILLVILRPFSSLLDAITAGDIFKTVVMVGQIQPDLSVNFPRPVIDLLQDGSLESSLKRAYLRKRCIVLLVGGERFITAQRKGEVNVSFSEWCKQKEEEGGNFQTVFRAFKKRLLLFNNGENKGNLTKQLLGLVYTSNFLTTVENWLPEADVKLHTFERGLVEFKEQVREKISSLGNDEKTDSKEAEENPPAVEDERSTPEEPQQAEDQPPEIENGDGSENEVAGMFEAMFDQNLEMIEKNVLEAVAGRVSPGSEVSERFRSVSVTTIWHRVLSLHRVQAARQVGLFLLVVILALTLLTPLVSQSRLVSLQTASVGKRLSHLDDDLALRRYTDKKLTQAAKRFEKLEEELNGLKMDRKVGERNEFDVDRISKLKEEMEENFVKLKEQFLTQTADLVEEFRNNSTRRTYVWDMIKSLPVSLPLILMLTLVMLFLLPVRLPAPQATLMATLLIALIVLQLLLLLVLLGV